ncbi:hypothetical protein [Virgibacillus sp. 6R]|uniref:hypothetical protein n=1 Tax=Metabacillus sp. 22489 TaxID=3453928 RepID=UPI00119F90FB
MIVDDHAINSLRTWFDIAYEELKKEWVSEEYEILSHCPSYKATLAYYEAMNVLIKASYTEEYLRDLDIKTLEDMIEEELELESFWESKKD